MPNLLLAAERLRTLLRAHETAGNRSGLLLVSSADLRELLNAMPEPNESAYRQEPSPAQWRLPYKDDDDG